MNYLLRTTMQNKYNYYENFHLEHGKGKKSQGVYHLLLVRVDEVKLRTIESHWHHLFNLAVVRVLLSLIQLSDIVC